MGKNKRIAIIGAGMGGPMLALNLQRAGYQVTIYEQAPVLYKIGAGIFVQPNWSKIFRKLGLEDKLLAGGVRPKQRVSRDGITNEILFDWPTAELEQKYGGVVMAYHRGALQDLLVGELKPNTIRFGKRLSTLDYDGDKVTMQFEDGTAEEADAVIGADGIHSRVRAVIAPESSPVYYGTVAFRSQIPSKLVGGLKEDTTKWWGPDRMLITYYMDERREVINLITGSPEAWEGPLSPKPATKQELLETYKNFNSDVQRIIEGAENISKWPMAHLLPFPHWNKGPIVLMGDAAHATTPHMGQGGGMSFEDAIVLFRCIQEAGDGSLDTAFKRFVKTRFERCSRLQGESAGHSFGRFGPGADLDFVYGYDPFEVALAA